MSEIAGHEILEHTADLGIRAWGRSIEEAVEQTAWGLVDILGARSPGPGREVSVRASGTDTAGALVDLLNELILLHETEGVGVCGIRVLRVEEGDLEAVFEVVRLSGPLEGTGVKAATYHQLSLGRTSDGRVEARVYLDV